VWLERGQQLEHLESGVPTAVARASRRPLRLAAKVDPFDLDYHRDVIEPMLGGSVAFVGELDEDDKPGFLGAASGLLFPSDWPEPFGLVMIESLAAGTPVIVSVAVPCPR
jgi:glycosyltransferase involved in cell wall biosynthesis